MAKPKKPKRGAASPTKQVHARRAKKRLRDAQELASMAGVKYKLLALERAAMATSSATLAGDQKTLMAAVALMNRLQRWTINQSAHLRNAPRRNPRPKPISFADDVAVEKLIRKLREKPGDAAAWDLMMRSAYPQIRKFARGCDLDPAAVDDVVQDVALEMKHSIVPKFKLDGKIPFRAYLSSKVQIACQEHMKRQYSGRKAGPTLGPVQMPATAETIAITPTKSASRIVHAVFDALSDLDAGQRRKIEVAYIESQPPIDESDRMKLIAAERALQRGLHARLSKSITMDDFADLPPVQRRVLLDAMRGMISEETAIGERFRKRAAKRSGS